MGVGLGIEEYEELRQQMERAKTLDPDRRKVIQDRIQELEFLKETETESLSDTLPIVIGYLAILIAVFTFVIEQRDTKFIILMGLGTLVLIGLLVSAPKWIEHRQKPYNEKIRKNYEILTGKRP